MADASNNEETPKKPKEKTKPESPHCGVIMPISGSADYPASHWADMLLLIREAAKAAQFTCEIVSATGRDDIIHTSIVTNIYQNEIVVCDVSSRNPNVMLELGLRLASKLPVIIIFDGQGSYPFDIGTIRYIPYPKDMRYYDTQKFKEDLTAKILEVYDTHKKGEYKSFLSHFKNVNFDLDSIGSETQTLKDFMERIDTRLSSIEREKESPIVRKASYEVDYIKDGKHISYRRLSGPVTVHELIERYLYSNSLNTTLKLSKAQRNELVDQIVEANLEELAGTPRAIIASIVNNFIPTSI